MLNLIGYMHLLGILYRTESAKTEILDRINPVHTLIHFDKNIFGPQITIQHAIVSYALKQATGTLNYICQLYFSVFTPQQLIKCRMMYLISLYGRR